MLAESPGKFRLVPGKPHESQVWKRINSSDEKETMPPPNSNLTLTRHQKNLIKAWIKQGVAYEKHWAFVPPVNPDIPKVKNTNWPKNPIDPLVGTPASYAKKPLMEITDEDVRSVFSFVNKPDTVKLIVSVMGELDTLRKNYVWELGIFDAYGEEVFPATPESILSFPPSAPLNRLGLVDWLFDPQNPLTARVFVNLLWKDVFGRDHHPRCFSIWMAGGGIKPGLVYGETDDFSYNIIKDPVHVHDFHATVLHRLGLDHEKLVYKHLGSRFRLTDVAGRVVHDLLG